MAVSTGARPADSVAAEARLTVIITAKGPKADGGVVNFVRSLGRQSSGELAYDFLQVGREPGERRWVRDHFFPLLDNWNLCRKVLRGAPDCVHLNPSLNAAALLRDGLMLLTLRLLRYRPVIVFFHGWDAAFAEKLTRKPLLRRVFLFVFGWQKLSFVLASDFRETLIRLGMPAERIRVTTTMFDGGIFEKIERRRDAADEEIRILFMSRFVREKGVYETINAVYRLAGENPRIRLILVGDGPEADSMRARVKDLNLEERVEFAGYLNGGEKAQALVDADVFLFPTYYGEGCPVSLLEAMAAGLPVITHAAGGIPDIFEDGSNGVLLSAVNDDSVHRALARLLSAPEGLAEMRDRNRSQAWSRFEAAVVSREMFGAYQEVM